MSSSIKKVFGRQVRWFATALVVASVSQLSPYGQEAYAADPYPSRTVRIIVPYAAGGVADAIARTASQGLSEKWKQTVIVENRPGAAGNIGMGVGAKAEPDGYTLVLAPAGNLTVNPILFPKLGFDTATAFAPITLLANSPNVLVAHPTVPAKNFKELVAYAKANPGKLNYASPGIGSGAHLAGELLNLDAGIKTVHVSFNGMAPAVSSLLGGHVQLMFAALSTALPHIQSGKLVPLAVAGPTRLDQLKDVPTVAENGYPGFDVTSWYGLVGRAGTPRAIIEKIQADVAAVFSDPGMKRKLDEQGVEAVVNTPKEFEKTIKTETEKWRDVVHRAGITPNQ